MRSPPPRPSPIEGEGEHPEGIAALLLTIIPLVAGLGLLLTLALMALRYGWSQSGDATPAGGGFWVLSLVAAWLWWSTLSTGLKAGAKAETYRALASLPVVTAEDVRTKPELVGQAVVVQDRAFCHETLGKSQGALAVRTSYSGQEEVEGENSDYIVTRDYGKDQEVARFSLGDMASPVRVDNDALTVLPAAGGQRVTVQTSEYSPAAGGYLQEYQDIAAIPCEAQVAVTGIVSKQGEFYILEPLPRSLALLSDRPWPELIAHAQQRAEGHGRSLMFWFVAALGAGLIQLFMALSARKKA